jgi:hypothetical protein
MKLLDARVNGMPRTVNTKYGEKSVLDVATSEGEFTIWRNAGDREVLGRRNGERVTISLDSKGKASLVDEPVAFAPTAPANIPFEAQTQQMGFAPVPAPSRSAEIVDYIQRLGKLYNACLDTAVGMPTQIELESTAVKDIATTLFIQTVRHFDL